MFLEPQQTQDLDLYQLLLSHCFQATEVIIKCSVYKHSTLEGEFAILWEPPLHGNSVHLKIHSPIYEKIDGKIVSVLQH